MQEVVGSIPIGSTIQVYQNVENGAVKEIIFRP
jgi:hypothetical protein